MRHFDDSSEVAELARLILDARDRPLVVVSTVDASGSFGYDPAHVAHELDGDADVVTVLTGPLTYALESMLPPKAHVFNGTARSYPPSFGTDPDYRRSILRFPDRHPVDELVDDALAQVTAAPSAEPSLRPVWAQAIVERVSGATGNVARLADGRQTLINSDRLPPAISLGDGLVVGAPVSGWLLDKHLSPEPASPQDEIDRFTDGSITLARVVKVTERRATLVLHPLLEHFILRRRDVVKGADDPAEDDDGVLVSDVVHLGQTVRTRVVRTGAELALTLIDVDHEAALVTPLPLLRDGTPWLHEGVDAPCPEASERATPQVISEAPALPDAEPDAPRAARVQQEPGNMAEQNLHALALESTVNSTTHSPAATASVALASAHDMHAVRDELTSLRGAFERFSREMRAGTDHETIDQLQDEVNSTRAELSRERERRTELSLMVSRLTQELREARSASPSEIRPDRASHRSDWPDAESWLRHEIVCAWVARTTASDKHSFPLKRYEIGPGFAASVEQLDERSFSKAMRAVADVVMNRAAHIASRELHQLRTGTGGGDPYVRREDGSTCWRVSLESHTPQARRLHYWKLPSGIIELSKVSLHDDFEP
ncbi:hypothetical protein ACXR2T_11320 [Leucobacter sp. HY1910]